MLISSARRDEVELLSLRRLSGSSRREAVFGETLEGVDTFAGDFAVAMVDEDRGGPADQIAKAMLRDGVNISDPAAVQAWIGRYSAEQPG